ncbi:translation initiation factor eIF-1A [Candidatus Pacearchaeota archaeon]|nr:translation initiation factor eIF-1A [Candidatus Pacearchaeota archaeon]
MGFNNEEEFKDINENEANPENPNQSIGPIRVRLPRGEQLIGIIEQRHGGNKMMVACLDGKSRNCRVPGRLKRALWLRPGDIVIVELWEFDKNRGDIIFKYTPTQVSWLKNKGYLKSEKLEF